jgi:hypothetical protein
MVGESISGLLGLGVGVGAGIEVSDGVLGEASAGDGECRVQGTRRSCDVGVLAAHRGLPGGASRTIRSYE